MSDLILTLHSTRSSSDPSLLSLSGLGSPGLGLAGRDNFLLALKFLMRERVFSILQSLGEFYAKLHKNPYYFFMTSHSLLIRFYDITLFDSVTLCMKYYSYKLSETSNASA